MKPYSLTTEAQGDFDDIIDHIAIEASQDRAVLVHDQFEANFERLARMPGIGHTRENLLSIRYKFWSVYSYVIVYRWEENPIQIVAIVHGARHLESFFADRPV